MNASGLDRTLGAAKGTALMLNIVLGAGLLTLPGLAFRAVGADALWLWLACAVAASPLLAVFSIAGRRFPDAGGIPALAGRMLGRGAYTAATFVFFGAVALGLPAIAIAGGYYASNFIAAPPWLAGAGIAILATLVNLLSAEIAGRVNGAIASLLVLVLLAIVILGAITLSPSERAGILASPGFEQELADYVAAFLMVFFAFTGWEVATHLGGEFRDPRRDIPRAMYLSFLIAVSFYLALAAIVGASGISSGFEAPYVTLFSARYGPFAAHAVAGAAVLLIFANLSAAIWAVSRMVYSASREGLLPGALARTTNGTPLRAVLLVLFVVLCNVGLASLDLLPIDRLLEFSGQNFLILYGIAAVAVFRAGPGFATRLVAATALVPVLVILALRDPMQILYPLALAASGIAASRLMRPRTGGTIATTGSGSVDG
jgi:amino acid efflux transporter